MLFTSCEYLLIFLPSVWLLFLALRFTVLRPVLLTISGYVFYAWGRPWISILLFLSSTVDFLIGLSIDRAVAVRTRRALLTLSLIFNLGLLSIFKYGTWLLTGVNAGLAHFHFHNHIPVPDIILPPGISFYTFQSLAYIIDIYRRKQHAHRRIWDYWSFVAFFPQLFAGPIERAGQLLPQLTHPRRKIHPRMIESGIFMIMWGVFKKLVVADNLGELAQLCHDNKHMAGSGVVLVLAFTFQIYADFSAYTDIARGSARLFGIKLRRNFLTPYFSQNPSEFWQRWHISLSSWIRDYLYVGLGGNRCGRARTITNLLITMSLAGLWHGAGMFFILWGLYHGLLLVMYHVWPLDKWLVRKWGQVGKATSAMVMFALTVIGWRLFYHDADTQFAPSVLAPAVSLPILLYGLALFASPLILTDVLGYRKQREFVDLWGHLSGLTKTAVYLFIFYATLMFGARDSHEFIYFRF